MQETYTIGPRTFVLDRAKAQEALAAKRVVGGRETMTFNLLPLRYGWAYELYRTMKANHWEPEDVPMQQATSSSGATRRRVSDIDRWIVRMGIGYFSAAEGIVGDNVHPRRPRARHRPRAQARPRPPRARGEHPRRLAALHDLLAGDQPARVRGDVRATSRRSSPKNEFVTEISRELRRDLDMTRDGEQAPPRPQHLRLRPVHGGHAVLRPVRDDPVAVPAEQAARDRDDVPLHAAGRVQPHRGLPAPAARARRGEARRLDAARSGRSCASSWPRPWSSSSASSRTACRWRASA